VKATINGAYELEVENVRYCWDEIGDYHAIGPIKGHTRVNVCSPIYGMHLGGFAHLLEEIRR
jgi:hypothetical protein